MPDLTAILIHTLRIVAFSVVCWLEQFYLSYLQDGPRSYKWDVDPDWPAVEGR